MTQIPKLLIIFGLILIVGCTPVQEISSVQETVEESSPKIVATGTFTDVQGSVAIVLDKGKYKLSIENLNSQLTPDLRLYLITTAGEKIEVHKFEQEPIGNFEFDLAITDISNIAAVELYCVYCDASFGQAILT